MGVKNVTLYSLPYVVGVASILAVAQQLAPPITSLDVSHTTTIKQTISGQTVNRALKQYFCQFIARFLHALRRSS